MIHHISHRVQCIFLHIAEGSCKRDSAKFICFYSRHHEVGLMLELFLNQSK